MAWQRKIPFGYQVQNGRINCHPEEAELVRAIFSRYLLGGSYSQIADEMARQGVRYHQDIHCRRTLDFYTASVGGHGIWYPAPSFLHRGRRPPCPV